MKFDVITSIDPYWKIGFIYLPDACYRHGDIVEVVVNEDLSSLDPSKPVPNFITEKTERIIIKEIRLNDRIWLVVPTEQSLNWWKNIRGFRELQ